MNRWHFDQRVDLKAGAGDVIWPNALMMEGDNQAHAWQVQVRDGGEAVDMSLYGITAYFQRADGKTVIVIGAAEGDTATVVLPQSAYAVPGQMLGVMRASSGEIHMTLAAGRWTVRTAPDGEYVDPGRVVPGLPELLDRIAEMENAAENANRAATSANAAAQAADEAKATALAAAEEANTAADGAEKAGQAAAQATQTAEEAWQALTGDVTQARDAAAEAADNANAAAEAAREAAGRVNDAAAAAAAAAADAKTAEENAESAKATAENAAKKVVDAETAAENANEKAAQAASATEAATAAAQAADEARSGIQADLGALRDGKLDKKPEKWPTWTEEQQATARESISAADSAIVEQNQREIFGFGDGITSRMYRVTFNAVWSSKKNAWSESASLAEISFYDADGNACEIESIAADSAYGAAYTADKAIDGDLTTIWSSEDDASVQHWLMLTFPREASPAQMGICLRSDSASGIIDEMTVEAKADDGTWFEAAHITGAMDGWDGQTERRFALKYRLPSLEEKYGRTVAIAADALSRETKTGTQIVISDAIAGRAMRCDCESPVTVRSLNRLILGDVSFTGPYKNVKFKEPIPAGTYRFSTRTESTDTDSTQSLVRIGGKSLYFARDGARHGASFTLTDACDSMYFYSSNNAANGTGDTAYWRDIMIVDGNADLPYEPGRETAVYESAADVVLHEITNILSAETDITITYARRNDWLNAVLSATKSAELNAETLGYVTPEMFGAVGDGVTDDLAPVQAALTFAQEKDLPMQANRSYFVSGSVVIGSNVEAKINRVICTAAVAAVQIKGDNTRVSIRSIKANGVGLEMLADGNNCLNNDVDLEYVKSGSDCVRNTNVNGAISGNSIRFRQLSAGGDGCYCIHNVSSDGAKYTTENTYTGGQCTNADYAYAGGGGNNKFYNFQVEGNIKGGFLTFGGQCIIIGARYAESQRDGEYPFIKIKTLDEVPNTNAASVASIRFIGNCMLKVNEIDLSEVTTTVYQEINPENKSKLSSTAELGHIDCQINGYGITGHNGYTIYQKFGDGALIWGNCLILQGVPRRRYRVEQSLDLRTIGADTPALPTIFEIGCADCEIWLHPTYCFMGVDRFKVVQTAENTATVYDYYSGNVIFDGASLGEGEFEVETYLDVGYTMAMIDGKGMAWRVRRIN